MVALSVRRIGIVLLASSLTAVAVQPVSAFEIFGFKLFGKDKEDPDEDFIGTPQNYEAQVEVAGGDEAITEVIENASSLYADQEKPASGAAGLIAKARNDYQRLLGALYAEGYYGGSISIRIDGREAGDLLPDADLADPAQVVVIVDPGPRFHFRRTEIVQRAPAPAEPGDEVAAPEEEGFAPGEIARSGTIRAAGRLAVESWRQQGHAKATLADRDVVAVHDNASIDAVLTVDPGPKAYYGPVTVQGAERMDPEFVAYMADLPEGAEFDPDDIERAEKRLQRLEVFASARAVEAESIGPGGSLPLSFVVQERLPRRFGIGGTLSTIDGAGVEAFWQHRNLFGRAEQLRFDARVGGIRDSLAPDQLTYRVGATFVKPGVFTPDTNFTASVTGLREVLDLYTRTSVAAKAGFTHIVSETLSGRLLFGVSHDRFEDILGTREFLTAGFEGAVTQDTRDMAIDATRGYLAEAVVEPFHEFRYGNTGARATIEGRAYHDFGNSRRMVVAGRVKAGTLVGVPIAEAPPDKLFFAGGGGSVRGYGFNSIGVAVPGGMTGGLSLLEASAELRAMVTSSIGLVGFVDAGTVGDSATPDFSGPYQIGAGVGLRYHTGLGPLRFDVAIPVNPRPGDPSLAAYIGLGQAF